MELDALLRAHADAVADADRRAVRDVRGGTGLRRIAACRHDLSGLAARAAGIETAGRALRGERLLVRAFVSRGAGTRILVSLHRIREAAGLRFRGRSRIAEARAGKPVRRAGRLRLVEGERIDGDRLDHVGGARLVGAPDGLVAARRKLEVIVIDLD